MPALIIGQARGHGSKRVSPPYLAKSERQRFIHAYCIVHLLVLSCMDRNHEANLVTSLYSIQYDVYYHVARWLINVCDPDSRSRRTDHKPDPKSRSDILIAALAKTTQDWRLVADSTIMKLCHWHPSIMDERDDYVCGYPKWNPEGIFSLFDQCQD